jgi:nitrite reductase/ring-hydroxylating ferredoxin subunit
MARVFVGREDEFQEHNRKVVASGDLEIGIFKVDGQYYAYQNRCPHLGGPACQGRIMNAVVEVLNEDKTSAGQQWSDEENIICPWHGWEFNLKTGKHPGNSRMALRRFGVVLESGAIYVDV